MKLVSGTAPIRRFQCVLVCVTLLLGAATVARAEEGSPGMKRMRKQVRELKRELDALRADMVSQTAQLRSRVDYLSREGSKPPGGIPPVSGFGGICSNPCSEDSDGDKLGDCEDVCPCEPANAAGEHADKDGDRSPDCIDPCPDDSTDACIDPCRSDSDGDGTNDCEDSCPWDPSPAVDGDEDGLVDCVDPCPGDAVNLCWVDPCLLDQDGDGLPDCKDDCPWVSNSSPVPSRSECLPRPLPVHPVSGAVAPAK